MNFPKVLGYKVRKEKILEQCRRHDISTEDGYTGSIERLIRRSGCPITGFSIQKHEDAPKGQHGIFIMCIYEAKYHEEEIDIQSILSRFPPIFEEIKKDLDIVGDPQIYLIEP
jgi:hypothetical protein